MLHYTLALCMCLTEYFHVKRYLIFATLNLKIWVTSISLPLSENSLWHDTKQSMLLLLHFLWILQGKIYMLYHNSDVRVLHFYFWQSFHQRSTFICCQTCGGLTSHQFHSSGVLSLKCHFNGLAVRKY
jgi:hypothetical protein